MIITIDPETHICRVGGQKVPSVTGIIKSAGLIDTDWFNEAAAWRGSVVHRVCELDDKGTLDDGSVDPGAAGYLAAWRACKRNLGLVVIGIEEPRYNEEFHYCGTPDRLLRLPDGSMAIGDLKTGAAQKWHAIQTAAYVHLYPFPSSFKRFTFRLFGDGRYMVTEYKSAAMPSDWAAFQGMLAVQNWRKINGA